MSRTITYTQEVTDVANHESDVIALEGATQLSVQYVCPGVPALADFDISVMVSNDASTWFYSAEQSSTSGNTLYNANFPDDAKFFEFNCKARFVKILIENYTEVTGPTVITTTLHIK